MKLLIRLVEALLGIVKKQKPGDAVKFKVFINRKEVTMLNVSIKADEKVTLTVVPVDRKDRPAPLKANEVPLWEVSPTGGVALFPSPDGLSCDVVGLAAMDVTLTVTGVAVSGATFKSTQDVKVNPADAVAFKFSAGPVIAQ